MNDALESPISTCRDLSEFFRETLVRIRERRSYPTSVELETYLAGMLADRATVEASIPHSAKPITVQLAEALASTGTERFARLRQIGDGALYTTGFLGDYLARRGIESEYVEQLGARAYATAGRMLLTDRTGDSGLLGELALRFHSLVALLHEVADTLRVGAARTPQAIVALYERWLAGGSCTLAAALASQGLVPLRATGSLQ